MLYVCMNTSTLIDVVRGGGTASNKWVGGIIHYTKYLY